PAASVSAIDPSKTRRSIIATSPVFMLRQVSMNNNVAIIGAGIGGLTAALALIRQGFGVDVYEQAPELKELGAGVQISSNGTRVLYPLGLGEASERIGGRVCSPRWPWAKQPNGSGSSLPASRSSSGAPARLGSCSISARSRSSATD